MSFHAATPQGAKHTTTDTWITPQNIIEVIGISDLDPCGFLPENGKPIVQTANNYFTEKDNGLAQDWSSYKTVFVNFPYSQSKEWMEKCRKEHLKGCEIIILCFVRSDTVAWQNNVKSATGINLISKRIKFLDSNGQVRSNGNAPSAFIAFGEEAFKRIKKINGLCFRNENYNV
jgi:phage N-6-adenine-methyltransferase